MKHLTDVIYHRSFGMHTHQSQIRLPLVRTIDKIACQKIECLSCIQNVSMCFYNITVKSIILLPLNKPEESVKFADKAY